MIRYDDVFGSSGARVGFMLKDLARHSRPSRFSAFVQFKGVVRLFHEWMIADGAFSIAKGQAKFLTEMRIRVTRPSTIYSSLFCTNIIITFIPLSYMIMRKRHHCPAVLQPKILLVLLRFSPDPASRAFPVSALPTFLVSHHYIAHDHILAGDRLDHVPNGQQGDRNSRQGFHLNNEIHIVSIYSRSLTSDRIPTSTPVLPSHSAVAFTATHPPASLSSNLNATFKSVKLMG